MEIVQGTVTNSIYKNEETGFAVLELKDADGEEFTAVGTLAFVLDGERVELCGQWVTHPEYGHQFRAESYTTLAPTTEEGMVRYLSSGAVKGIGIQLAERIVKKFGAETLNILNFEPERLMEVEGIGEKKLERMIRSLQEHQGMREVMLFLQTYGITALFANKIYNKFGKASIQLVQQDPYVLADEIDGIGFAKADKIARAMGVALDAPMRINAGIQYLLKKSAGEGHTFLPQEVLQERVNLLTGASEEVLQNAITSLALQKKIAVVEHEGQKRIYHYLFYYAERYVAQKIMEIQRSRFAAKPCSADVIANCCQAYEQDNGIQLCEGQRKAIQMAAEQPISIITGGPGTGKTTIIKCLLDIFEMQRMKVSLAAPTGRAAKRMGDMTGRGGQTLHRLLEYGFEGEGKYSFGRGEANPLECDVLIIDELSMVDIMLLFYTLRACDDTMRIVLVGDADQLPSVGPGNVLRDLIGSGAVPVTQLVEVYRQDAQSMIVLNAHRINQGEMPEFSGKYGDFFMLRRNSPQQILETLVDVVTRRLNDYYGFEPIRDIQVLAPARKGIAGIVNINKVLQASLNPPSEYKNEYLFGDCLYREGDRVMQVKNNYTIEWTCGEERGKGIFNGDIGIITEIDENEECLTVEMDDGKQVVYPFAGLDEVDLAYALTVHKSQGNQFPVVVLPLAGGNNMLFNRSLLYTAITRAEKLVVLVGREDVLRYMVQNDFRRERYTGLGEMFASVDEEQPQIEYEYDGEDDRNDMDAEQFGVIDWDEMLDF